MAQFGKESKRHNETSKEPHSSSCLSTEAPGQASFPTLRPSAYFYTDLTQVGCLPNAGTLATGGENQELSDKQFANKSQG